MKDILKLWLKLEIAPLVLSVIYFLVVWKSKFKILALDEALVWFLIGSYIVLVIAVIACSHMTGNLLSSAERK